MNRRSFFQVVLLAVFGALAVAGILVFAFAVGGGNRGGGIGKVVIWGTFDKATFNTVLERAGSLDPELQQVTYVQKDPATFEANLNDALAQKSGPDLFILSSDYAAKDEAKIADIPYEPASGLPASISKVQFQSAFAEAANPFLGQNGVIGVPVLIDPLVLYWNRDLFASAGFAVPPKYWDDVPAMAATLTTRDATGQIQTSAIALGTFQNIENAKSDLALLLMQQGVAIVSRSSTGPLTADLSGTGGASKAPAVDALNFYTSFADPSQPSYSWSGAVQSARASFAAGDAAMYVGYASEGPTIAAMNPNLNFAVADIPQFRGAARSDDFGRAYALAVPRVSNNIAGAMLAAELLDSATTSTALSNAIGVPSALRSVLAQPSQGYGTTFNRMALITRIWNDPDPDATSPLFQAMIEDTISGAVSSAQAVQRGGQQLSHIISGN